MGCPCCSRAGVQCQHRRGLPQGRAEGHHPPIHVRPRLMGLRSLHPGLPVLPGGRSACAHITIKLMC